jgi:hypothetical protein
LRIASDNLVLSVKRYRPPIEESSSILEQTQISSIFCCLLNSSNLNKGRYTRPLLIYGKLYLYIHLNDFKNRDRKKISTKINS